MSTLAVRIAWLPVCGVGLEIDEIGEGAADVGGHPNGAGHRGRILAELNRQKKRFTLSGTVVDDDFRHLGQRLQGLRREQGLTLDVLAADSGLSPGYLSQIENGQAVPSLTALQVIAAGLGVEVATFFPDETAATTRVVRAAERRAFRLEHQSGEEYAVLAQQVKDSAFTAVHARHLPGAGTLPFRHLGEEFALVLSGRLRLLIGEESYELGPGEWAHYSSQHGHSAEVVSDEPVEALWILAPAVV